MDIFTEVFQRLPVSNQERERVGRIQKNFRPMIVDVEVRLHETVVLKILHLIYIKLNIALQ